jgi:predicted phosphodiesterase
MEIIMSELKQRFLLVSDMHYTTEETAAELKLIYPNAKASVAAGNAFGKKQREKIEKVYTDIMEENRRSPLDAVIVLGDLSIDDYDFRNLPFNFCKKFKEDCLDRLPCPSFALPGNHDGYTNELWREVFGYDRQYAVEFGDTVFIMADTFADVPGHGAAGSAHTLLDEDFLKECLEKYKGKRIFLCAHHFNADRTFAESTKALIKSADDIVCLFRGHVHINSIIDLGEDFGGKELIDIGGYGYCGRKVEDKWEFNIFDFKWAWGYQIIEIYDDKIKTYHVKTDNRYVATNGVFDVTETVEGEKEYKI